MEQSKKFIKFVIPCWGVEKTIGKMLDSILSQTFTDYHVVCVEDCSLDKTWQVLQDYKKRFPNKITLIKNPKNLGAGESRNIGVQQTMDSLPSEFLWVVDGDDWIADKSVLQKIYDFVKKNPQFDIINLGWTFRGKYEVARCGWPAALWGRVVKPSVYVPAISDNIPYANDIYPSFVMFDMVDDSHIGSLDCCCYVYSEMARRINNTEKFKTEARDIGLVLMKHKFKKRSVVEEFIKSPTGIYKRIKLVLPDFKLELDNTNRKVSILMASFPYRKKWMLQCIEKLLPQCDNFYLWLNEYKEIPEELKKFDQNKLHITLGQKNLKENGRYTFLTKPELQNDYCFICDDDINWPQDYVKNTLECFKRNGDNIVTAYYIHNSSDFIQRHLNDEKRNPKTSLFGYSHCRFGLGTSAFVPGLTKFKFSYNELSANYDMEMFWGQQCLDRKIRIYTPKHSEKWITFIRNTQPNCNIDKFALHMSNVSQRICRTLDYMRGKQHKVEIKPRVGTTIGDHRKFQFG